MTRRLARTLLASMFVVGGLDALRHPATKVPAAQKVTSQLGLADTTEEMVQLNGAVQVAGGVALALGIVPRVAAVALIGSIVPTTLAGHRFWEEDEPANKAAQRIHFLKNAGLLGGLMLAALDTEGRPSLSWRAHRAVEHAGEHLPSVLTPGAD